MGTSPLSGKVAQFYAAGPGQDLSDKPIEVVNLRIKGAYEDDIDKRVWASSYGHEQKGSWLRGKMHNMARLRAYWRMCWPATKVMPLLIPFR